MSGSWLATIRHWVRPTSLAGRLVWRIAIAGFAFFIVTATAVVSVTARVTAADVEERITAVATAASGAADAQSVSPQMLCQRTLESGATPVPFPRVMTREIMFEVRAPNGQICQAADAPAIGEERNPPLLTRWITGAELPRARGSDGVTRMVLSTPVGDGWVLRVGGDLSTFSLLAQRLSTTMLLVSVPAAAIAAFVGWFLTRGGLRPVRELADAAQNVARTQNLAVALPVSDSPVGEVSRLTTSFNEMMAALAQARARQAQLVADAGHELRTPLTSLRTNIDLLVRSENQGRPLPPADRQALFADVTAQIDELAELVGEIVVLAHDPSDRQRVNVRLDEVAARAVGRARRRAGGRRIAVNLSPWVVPEADPDALERAIINLLDNAVKFSPPGSTVSITLRDGHVVVDDEGPGVPPQYRREVFARFWRGSDARSMPGSGLGLAIVAETATAHGGRVVFDASPSGGGRVVLTLLGATPSSAPVPHQPR
ncbi:MAG: HAMP domain-containing sensor histidine kinase [Actinomycetota bacterium]